MWTKQKVLGSEEGGREKRMTSQRSASSISISSVVDQFEGERHVTRRGKTMMMEGLFCLLLCWIAIVVKTRPWGTEGEMSRQRERETEGKEDQRKSFVVVLRLWLEVDQDVFSGALDMDQKVSDDVHLVDRDLLKVLGGDHAELLLVGAHAQLKVLLVSLERRDVEKRKVNGLSSSFDVSRGFLWD